MSDRTNLQLDARQRKAQDAVSHVGASPVAAQLAFIKGLATNKAESQAFLKDPKKYAVDHGVLLDPKVVQTLTRAVFADPVLENPSVSKELIDQFGEKTYEQILDMRSPGSIAAWPAAAAAAAAVVAAAAAVVTVVVTLVRTSRPEDLVALQGLGPKGILLPGNITFKAGQLGPLARQGGG